MSTYEQILEYTSGLEIIDTHEHLVSDEQTWLKQPWRELLAPGALDIFKEYLLLYFSSDLVSAGLPLPDLQRVRTTDIPVIEKWNIVEPYWEFARHTGYGRALDIAAEGIYGLPAINRNTIEELNKVFLEHLKPGHYKKVLQDLSKIKIGLLMKVPFIDPTHKEDDLGCDRTFFRPVFDTTPLVVPDVMQTILKLEGRTGIRITSFDAWLKCCEKELDRAIAAGAVALKSVLAYTRPILFERTTRALAEGEFNEFLNSLHRDQLFDQIPIMGTNAQNYIMHHIFELANERQLVFQFHTGFQEGTGNYISWTDPALLTNAFVQYPDIRFDIFHIGYPFQQTLSSLAKNFANVYIDMCWAHIISPQACIDALVEWLEAVPYNKICGFGGDYVVVDAVYGHQQIARENISRALSIKVSQGLFDVEKAKEIAECILYKNPKTLFRLGAES